MNTHSLLIQRFHPLLPGILWVKFCRISYKEKPRAKSRVVRGSCWCTFEVLVLGFSLRGNLVGPAFFDDLVALTSCIIQDLL